MGRTTTQQTGTITKRTGTTTELQGKYIKCKII